MATLAIHVLHKGCVRFTGFDSCHVAPCQTLTHVPLCFVPLSSPSPSPHYPLSQLINILPQITGFTGHEKGVTVWLTRSPPRSSVTRTGVKAPDDPHGTLVCKSPPCPLVTEWDTWPSVWEPLVTMVTYIVTLPSYEGWGAPLLLRTITPVPRI